MAGGRYRGIRARDADRADVCGLLDAALADGQLTTAEHRSRTETAMRAETFGALDELIGDLQIPQHLVDSPVVRADRRGPRRWLAPVGLISAALVAGAMTGAISRCGASGPTEQVPVLTSGAGLGYFIAEYRTEFGDTSADEVTLYPEYVLFDRRAEQQTRKSDYRYDGGFRRYSSDSARDSGARAFDLATIDLPALAGLIAGAPRTLRIPDGAVTHISLEYQHRTVDLGAVAQIHVRNAAGKSAHMTVTFAGEPLMVHPLLR